LIPSTYELDIRCERKGEITVENEKNVAELKQEWVRPELQRIEAGSAESGFQGRADGVGQEAS
jgi:hypothetical protein